MLKRLKRWRLSRSVGRSPSLPLLLLHGNQAGLDFRACTIDVRRVRARTCTGAPCRPAAWQPGSLLAIRRPRLLPSLPR